MDNSFVLIARIAKCSPVRYTPAGIPVLDLVLQHESQQRENGRNCTAKLEITAKIVGADALAWQHRENTLVQAGGFLSARSRRSGIPILRIQNIQEYKG